MTSESNNEQNPEKQEITHPWEGHYMEGAFLSFVSYIISTPERMAEFEAHSGLKYSRPQTPFDAMIDDATGYNQKIIQAIIDFAVTQFGTPEQVGVAI